MRRTLRRGATVEPQRVGDAMHNERVEALEEEQRLQQMQQVLLLVQLVALPQLAASQQCSRRITIGCPQQQMPATYALPLGPLLSRQQPPCCRG